MKYRNYATVGEFLETDLENDSKKKDIKIIL